MNPNDGFAVDSGPSHPGAQLRTEKKKVPKRLRGWRRHNRPQNAAVESSASSVDEEKDVPPTEKWSLGILNDKRTEEVPGRWLATVTDVVI
jgi:hypothetical protein